MLSAPRLAPPIDVAQVFSGALCSIEAALSIRLIEAISDREDLAEDGLPLGLGSLFLARLQELEDDDGVPPMTEVIGAGWLSIRQHIGALSILQLDRATSAMSRSSCTELVALLWDAHELIGEMYDLDQVHSSELLQLSGTDESRQFGSIGGKRRHAPTNAVKEWALGKAANMKGDDRSVARELSQLLPVPMLNVSKDPERLIYEALLARRRQPREGGSRNG